MVRQQAGQDDGLAIDPRAYRRNTERTVSPETYLH